MDLVTNAVFSPCLCSRPSPSQAQKDNFKLSNRGWKYRTEISDGVWQEVESDALGVRWMQAAMTTCWSSLASWEEGGGGGCLCMMHVPVPDPSAPTGVIPGKQRPPYPSPNLADLPLP